MVTQESPGPTGAASTAGCKATLAKSAKSPASRTATATESHRLLPPLGTEACDGTEEGEVWSGLMGKSLGNSHGVMGSE